MIEHYSYCTGSDGINDEVTSALKRAYEARIGGLDRAACRWIRQAEQRIGRQETTLKMECDVLGRQQNLRVW